MSTLAQVHTPPEQRRPRLVPSLILLGLVVVLYAPVLKLMAEQWWRDANNGQGLVVPVFAAYVFWRRKSIWERIAPRPSNFGLLVMLGSIAMLMAGTIGAELFISRISMIFLIAGLALFLLGWKMLRLLVFPLGYLLLMVPLPAILFNQVTFPLQLLASRLAAGSLELLRVPVLREGNVLLLPNYALEVVEACSGIRSLMSLVALALAYGYIVENRLRIRTALVALMIPIAVLSNALRVVGTGLLTYLWGPKSAEGFFHAFSGWLIFMAAVVLMLVAHAILRRFGAAKRVRDAS